MMWLIPRGSRRARTSSDERICAHAGMTRRFSPLRSPNRSTKRPDHDLYPSSTRPESAADPHQPVVGYPDPPDAGHARGDRKSTRLNSSHVEISYAVFCLKKQNMIATDMS